MGLSDTFTCIPPDFLIAKTHTYVCNKDDLVFFQSYLKTLMQNVEKNNTQGLYQTLFSGVPQGSILSPIFFNFFINDLFPWVKNIDIYNFTDDHTLPSILDNLGNLIWNLECASEGAINWLRDNTMIHSPSKFKSIIFDYSKIIIIPTPWTERKLNVHKMFRRRPGRLLNVLCTFNLHPVSRGQMFITSRKKM